MSEFREVRVYLLVNGITACLIRIAMIFWETPQCAEIIRWWKYSL